MAQIKIRLNEEVEKEASLVPPRGQERIERERERQRDEKVGRSEGRYKESRVVDKNEGSE